MWEFLLWHNQTGNVLGALGHRCDTRLAQWVKDPVLPQLWLRSQLQLRSHPGLGTSCAVGQSKKEKTNKKETPQNNDSKGYMHPSVH